MKKCVKCDCTIKILEEFYQVKEGLICKSCFESLNLPLDVPAAELSINDPKYVIQEEKVDNTSNDGEDKTDVIFAAVAAIIFVIGFVCGASVCTISLIAGISIIISSVLSALIFYAVHIHLNNQLKIIKLLKNIK